MTKKTALSLFLSAGMAALSSAVEVDVNLNVTHSVGGVTELDRQVYFVLHASASENTWDSDAQETAFLNDNDVYLGRSNGTLPWHLSQTTEDPAKPGWCNHANMLSRGNTQRSNYASDTHAHSLEYRANNMMIGGQMNMLYPLAGNNNANGFTVSDPDALADFYEQFLTDFYGTGGTDGEPKPAMVEVVNEPFVAASSHGTTRADISRLHTNVAAAIHNSHPEVLVGGYCAAYPQYEGNNFQHWNDNWKTFIDIAGTDMDFFSLHLYDNPGGSTNVLNTQYRSGSNIEALLDMIEQYSMLTLGEVKPFNISEFGSLSIFSDVPYDPKNDWVDVRSYSTILMQLLERPNRMLQAIPFMMVQAEWGRSANGYPYPTRLLYDADELTGSPKDKDGPFVFTERIKYWQLWSDVRGTRVDTIASDPDIQTDAYVDGNNAYVIVSSLDHTGPQTVDLNVMGGNQTLNLVVVKHTYVDPAGNVILDTYLTNALDSITLPASSTAVIKYIYSGAVAQDEISVESKYYATTYLQPINAGSPIVFSITNVNTTAQYGEAVLRLGIGRAHGASLHPTLFVNGTYVPVPTDWRGYDQATRDQFFGVIEIPVHYDLLQDSNTISVEFSDGGGYVSSVALQVFQFSTNVRDSAIGMTGNLAGNDVILNFSNAPANSYFSLLSTSNLVDGVWETNLTGLPIDLGGLGSVTSSIAFPQEFFKIILSNPPGPTPPPAPAVIDFTTPDYSNGGLNGQQNWNAESGWTVANVAGSGNASTPDNGSAAVLNDPITLTPGQKYSLNINLQFAGTYATPSGGFVYTFLGGLKPSNAGASVSTGEATAADANIQIFNGADTYRLLNNYATLSGAGNITSGQLNAGDILQFDYELTLGAAAASTTYTVRLQNLTDGTDTGVGTVTGVDASVYNALTGTGAYAFFQTIAPGAYGSGLSGVQVNTVSTNIIP